MNKIASHALACFSGVLAVLIFMGLTRNNIDILSDSSNIPIVTSHEMKVVNEDGHELSIPSGTSLVLKSKYRQEGTYYLEIVSADLSKFKKSDKKLAYFAVEKQ